MAAATQILLETYLTTSYERDADFVDGVLEERTGGEYDHNVVQQAIMIWFYLHEKRVAHPVDPGTENEGCTNQGSHSRRVRILPRHPHRAGLYQAATDCHRGSVARRSPFPHRRADEQLSRIRACRTSGWWTRRRALAGI